MRVEYCFSLFMIESFLIRLPNIFEVFCCWWFYFSFLFWCHLHHQQQRIGASVEDKIVYIYISTVECCRKERRLKCRAETTTLVGIEENLDSRPRIREEKKAVFLMAALALVVLIFLASYFRLLHAIRLIRLAQKKNVCEKYFSSKIIAFRCAELLEWLKED